MKLNLDKEYNHKGTLYGPGETEVPARIAKVIKRHQERAAEAEKKSGADKGEKK
jgi:hypothetical protein